MTSQLSKQRLDQFISESQNDLNRSMAQHLIYSGCVMVDNKIVVKPSYKVNKTNDIKIDKSSIEKSVPDIEIPIFYEDDNCVVINKPTGLLTHSKGSFNSEATVASWLSRKLSIKDDSDNTVNTRFGIVHRLDRATSGVMICAKNQKTAIFLQKQFSARKVEKTYIALVTGNIKENHMMVDMPIERNPKKPQSFRVGSNGKPATTEIKVIKHYDSHILLEVSPKTGRTHQIRVHLSQLGLPIVGDVLYGGENADRMYLHSNKLTINLPDKKNMHFEAPIPDSFVKILNK